MLGHRIVIIAIVATMLAYVGYIGWVSRQAAGADVASGIDTPQHISRITDAIRQVEDDMNPRR